MMNFGFIKPVYELQSILKMSVNLYKFSKFLKDVFIIYYSFKMQILRKTIKGM